MQTTSCLRNLKHTQTHMNTARALTQRQRRPLPHLQVEAVVALIDCLPSRSLPRHPLPRARGVVGEARARGALQGVTRRWGTQLQSPTGTCARHQYAQHRLEGL
jgi:hypothetical protein